MRKALVSALLVVGVVVALVPAVKAVGAKHEQSLVLTAGLGRAGLIWSADMAYDAENNVMLAVWVNGDRIRGQFFSFNKTSNRFDELTGMFPVSYGAGHYFVRASYGAGKFLVSYGIARGAGFGIVREFRMVSYDAGADQEVVVPGPVSKGTELDTVAGRGSGASVFVTGGDKIGEGSSLGDHFIVSWPKDGQTYARVVYPDATLGDRAFRVTAASPCSLAAPEMAVNPATGVAMIVGFRDPTSDACAGQGGLWNRFIDDGGLPRDTMQFVVEGKDLKGLHWEQAVAFGEGRFQIAWNRKNKDVRGIYGRGYDDAGAVDSVTPIKLAVPGLPPWDNALGQVGIGYDPTTDKFLVGARGADAGDGKAAVWQLEVDQTGTLVPDSFQRLTENLAPAPEPVVDGDGTGYMFVLFRAGWSRLDIEIFEPESPAPVEGPNLAVSALTVPVTAPQGGTISITDTTINKGTAVAGAATKTRFYFSANGSLDAGDILLGERDVPDLGVGATDTATTADLVLPDATLIAPGTGYILAKADADDAVAEGSEFDNVTARSIIITGFDLRVDPLYKIKGVVKAAKGATITMSDKTCNLGPDAAPASITRYYLSKDNVPDNEEGDVAIGDRNVGTLAALGCDQGSVSVTIPATMKAGVYYMIARADGPKALFELIEPNNRQWIKFTVTN